MLFNFIKKQLRLKELAAFLINKNAIIIRYSVVILTIILITGLFPRHRFNYDYTLGQPWKYENLYAPFTLTILKLEDSLRLEQERALRSVIPYYRNEEKIKQIAVEKFPEALALSYEQHLAMNNIGIKKADSIQLNKIAQNLLDSIYQRGIIALTDTHRNNAIMRIRLLVEQNKAGLRPVSTFFSSVPEACKWANEQIDKKSTSAYRDIWLQSLCNVLQANIVYDANKTDKAKANEISNISETAGVVQANELIIAQGALVNTHNYRTLVSLKKMYESNIETSGWEKYRSDIGYLMITTIVIGIFLLFIRISNTNEFHNLRNLLFILGSITFFLYIVKTVVSFQQVGTNSNTSYILPFCIVPIVISNFFGSRLANYVHLVIVFLTGFIVPLGYEFLFLQFMVGLLAVLLNERTHYWSQFFVSVGLIFLCYCFSYIGITLTQSNGIENIETNTFAWFSINALLTLLAYPFIPLFEKLFGFVSSITLAELSDLNRPLIKRIYEKAPGTFWHSIQVANLAEAACSEIQANAMLAKVGALYHDIGKMKNPAYFIENQKTEINPHDELVPTESARIIKEHVTHGIELAKEAGLPNVIIDFIRTHHGNTRIELFYQRQVKEFPDTRLEETLFRYPGPLPYSKETAVVMLSDSVEAASRSLKSPTEEEINRLVENIIEHKIKQHQLAYCDISFKDITAIKAVFKKQLRSIYHVRISYPDTSN
jgi:putative nucleotidyltransferase with HDIG domain